MRVKFHWDSGANIHSAASSDWVDVTDELGYTEEEWKGLSDEEKYKEAEQWAWNYGLSVSYEEEA